MTIRPAERSERREVRVENGINVGYLCHENGSEIREIPEDGPEDHEWPCVAQGLDRGSVGCGGNNFLENCPQEDIDYLSITHYDKIHGLVRDDKNGIHKSPEHENAMCESSYVWG